MKIGLSRGFTKNIFVFLAAPQKAKNTQKRPLPSQKQRKSNRAQISKKKRSAEPTFSVLIFSCTSTVGQLAELVVMSLVLGVCNSYDNDIFCVIKVNGRIAPTLNSSKNCSGLGVEGKE